MLRVGVLLPKTIAAAGDYLADIAALDAAGADCLCVEGSGEGEWVILGAAAAVTHRARLAIIAGGEVAEESLSTLQRISGGRAMVFDRSEGLTVRGVGPVEAWAEIPAPADRKAWNEELASREAAGVAGVVVPWDPRL